MCETKFHTHTKQQAKLPAFSVFTPFYSKRATELNEMPKQFKRLCNERYRYASLYRVTSLRQLHVTFLKSLHNVPQGIRHSVARYIRACQTGGPRVACGPFEMHKQKDRTIGFQTTQRQFVCSFVFHTCR